MTTLTRAQLGALGEQLAVDHLTGLGLQVLDCNWRCRYGELDVIAVEKCAELHWMQHFERLRNQLSARWWGPAAESGIGALGP
ncbi:YraN family protein [Mycobacterium branderi]|uniref:Uncharacterized protein n=1 Tax=Mycobacterium branderi TaxID=43348 RepID=A0ABM7KU51_9MYCO|nr:YraN family protein [Mycobacterium branderi]BBZ14583.1 hypothetical protein MBRA_47780 [Mycobacterium branderi]